MTAYQLRLCNVLNYRFDKTAAVAETIVLALVLASTDFCSAATIIGPSVQLSTLLVPSATMVVGDKTFSEFGYSFTGDMPPATMVNVVGILDDEGNYGIRFQGGFMDFSSTIGGSDALIDYMVEAGDGFLISDAHLAGNPNVLGNNGGSMSVTETFLPLGANGEYTLEIYDDEFSNTAQLTDVTFFIPPVKKMSVQKDILGFTVPGGGTATMSMVDQTFSQIPIPEPATSLLLIGSALALGYRRRRRRS